MALEQLTRSDLERLYSNLSINGLGQWVKGHYAALSTIAYAEPLLYAVQAEKQGASIRDTAFILLEYWEGKIPQGGLVDFDKYLSPD